MKVRWRGCDVYGRKTFSECLLRNSNTKLGRLRKFGLRLVCCVRKLTWIESYITPAKAKSLLWLQRNYFKSTSKINFSPRKLIPTTEKRACLDCHKLSPLPTNQIPEQNCIYNLYYLALCDGVRISLVLWYVHNGLRKPIKEAQRIKTSTVTVSSKNWFSCTTKDTQCYQPTKLHHIPCNTGNVQRARNGGIAPWPHNILGYTGSSIWLFTANECTKFLQFFRNAKKKKKKNCRQGSQLNVSNKRFKIVVLHNKLSSAV